MKNCVFFVAASAFLWPLSATSTGTCEHTDTLFSLHSFSEKTMELVLKGEKEWCREKEDGAVVTEERGRWEVARVVHLKTHREQWFVNGLEKEDIKRHFLAYTGQPARGSFIDLAAYKKKHGFVDYRESNISPNGRCQISLKNLGREEEPSSFPHERLVVHIRQNGKQIHQQELGRIAEGMEARSAFLFLPKTQVIVGWFNLPICEAGPPPGYFGEDDPGTCHEEYDTEKIVISPSDFAWVQECFSKAPLKK